MMICSAKKVGGGKLARAAVAQGLAGHCLAGGQQMLILHYFSWNFVIVLLIKLSLSLLMGFLTSALLILFLSSCGGVSK